jgi:hypothetical protein
MILMVVVQLIFKCMTAAALPTLSTGKQKAKISGSGDFLLLLLL